MSDLTIRNARLFLPEGIFEGGLRVEDGIIKEISKGGLPEGEKDIDAGSKLVLPGAIDAHVHFYDPNYSHREDFENGSKAAAAGGVTTVISMPLDSPIIRPPEIKQAIEAGEENSIIDFGLHAGNMSGEEMECISSATELGINTFKIFTSPPYAVERNVRRRLMREIRDNNGIAFVHAEDSGVVESRTKEVKEGDRKDTLAYAETRPNEAERKAVENIISDQKETNCNLHLAHISTRQGGNAVKKAKNRGEMITAETCPHYLLFTKEDLKKRGPLLKTDPPVKSKKDRAQLWRLLSEGVIDILTTDHAPGTLEEKKAGRGNIWDAQTGIPGVETLLPLMFSDGVMGGRISLERFVESISTIPAKRFGLYPKKGTIEKETDADLVIIDEYEKWEIKDEDLHYKVGWSPYDGTKIKGLPTTTISRGEIVYQDGTILAESGRGQFFPRKL